MSQEAGALNVPFPKINGTVTGPRIDTKDILAAWRGTVTAGASQPIHDPLNSWDSYVGHVDWTPTSFNRRDTNDLLFLTALRDLQTSRELAPQLEPTSVPAAIPYLMGFGRNLLGVLSEQTTPNGAGVLTSVVIHDAPASKDAWAEPEPAARYEMALEAADDAQQQGLAQIRRDLDSTRSALARRSPQDLVIELTEDRGLGQLLVAKALGVSPTAVRKWRRGEQASPENRQSLARLAALCVSLDELDLHDPSSWLEMAISDDSDLTPIDVFIGGRPDLVVMLASD